MALVTCYDPDGVPHQKEPIDAREACLHNGFTMAAPGGNAAGGVAVETAPTMPELLAARDALMRRERELDDQFAALAEQKRANDDEAARLAEQGAANVAEAQRLADEAARLVVKDASAATEPPTEAPAAAPKSGAKAAK